jgi:hypothetical protein
VAADYLLFGFLCAVVEGERTLVFGIGDGVLSIDGKVTVLDPGPMNAPPYLAYALVGLGDVKPVVHFTGSARSVVIATDGLAELKPDALAELERDPTCFENPSWLGKRLSLLRVGDDATMAVLAEDL